VLNTKSMMKRFLVLLTIFAFVLPALQSVRAADVSINYFYDNLNGGNWYEVADYGYVWQPDVATNTTWRPYTDGYWAYTDVGWTWVSYEDFGWATYHYGRWARLDDYGWVWIPGYEWGPAWVSWRTGGDYVGWAPLPPAGGREVVYESQPIDYRVDAEYDIGPAYYNFIDVRYIGEPVLRDRIFDYNQNVAYVDRSVNVTNITYNNGMFYNYGPDYATVSAYSIRPIQRLRIERASIDPIQAVKMGNVTKVEGDRLILGAPMKLAKASGQIAPQKVKGKIDQPKFEKGWANVTDPSTKARLEQKFKTENPKNIPKATFPAKGGANAAGNFNATGSPNQNAPTGAATSPFEGKGKRKGEKFQNQPGASAVQGLSPGGSMAPVQQGKGKKNKGQKFENQPGPAGTLPGEGVTPASQGKGKKNRGNEFRGESIPSTTPGTPESAPPAAMGTELGGGKGKHKGEFRGQSIPSTAPGTPESGPPGAIGGGKGKHKGERAASTANPNAQPNASEGNPQGEGKRNRKLERMNAQENPNGPPPPPPAETGHRKGAGQAMKGQGFNQAGAGAKQRGELPRAQAQGQAQGQPQGQGQAQGQAQPQGAGQGKGKKNTGQVSPGPSPQ
jgi:hypothetical protein